MIITYLKLFKSNQSTAGLKSLKPARQQALLSVQIIALLFPFTVQKYVYPPVSKAHAGSLRVSVIHQTQTWTTGSLACIRDCSCVCVYTRGLGTLTASHVSTTFLTQKSSQFFLVLLMGFKPQSCGSWAQRTTNWATPSHVMHLLLAHLT